MSIKQFLRLDFSLALLSFPLLLWMTPPAPAQETNQSAATNVNATGSEIAPVFIPLPGGSTAPTFASDVQFFVDAAAATLNQQLAAGNLALDLTTNISPSSGLDQQIVLDVLTGTNDGTSLVSLLETISPPEATAIPALGVPPSNLIEQLVNSLEGLTANGEVDAGKLAQAVEAYNAVINGVTDAAYLTNPPGPLLTIRAVLSQLVAATTPPNAQAEAE